MDTTFKIALGVVSLLGVYQLLRIGGAQKSARDEQADRQARKRVADAKALKRSLNDRR